MGNILVSLCKEKDSYVIRKVEQKENQGENSLNIYFPYNTQEEKFILKKAKEFGERYAKNLGVELENSLEI